MIKEEQLGEKWTAVVELQPEAWEAQSYLPDPSN